jgi:hypothetical protein
MRKLGAQHCYCWLQQHEESSLSAKKGIFDEKRRETVK